MTLEQRYERLRKALSGISTCSTRCGCCELHVQIALEALNDVNPTVIVEDDEIPGVKCLGCED